MTAYGAQPGATLADVSARDREIDDLLDRGDRVAVLGESHRPAVDRRVGVTNHLGSSGDLLAGQPGGVLDDSPVDRVDVLGPRRDASRVLLDERVVDGVPPDQQRPDGLEQCEVAVDLDRQVQVGEVGALADQAAGLLRIAEVDEPGFAQRVDRDDLGAAELGRLEGREHARVVGAGVLAGDHDQLGVVDVAQADAALADADRFRERDARRLVAHVGAVGQVVGAVRADEQLIEERRLVRGATRRVEDRLVGGVKAGEVVGDQRERVAPRDRFVVRATGTLDHGMGDPALLAEPVLVVRVELGNAVLGEERRVGALLGGFLGDRLGAVLAELRGVAVAPDLDRARRSSCSRSRRPG